MSEDAKKINKKPEQKKGSHNQLYVAAFIFMLVLVIGVNYYWLFPQLKEHNIQGIKVLSKGDPYSEMRQILEPDKIVIKAVAYPEAGGRNRNITAITSEISYVLGLFNKTVNTYAYIPDETNESDRYLGCTEQTNFCKDESIVVALDSCNCMKLDGGKIYVLYEVQKLQDSRLRTQIRGVIGGVVKGK